MNHVTCLFVYLLLPSLNPEGRKLMELSVAAAVGSVAIAAADVSDHMERAARGRVDTSQGDEQGRSPMSQTDEDTRPEQELQSKDGGTLEAPPHQVQQEESHGPFPIGPLGERIFKLLHDGGSAGVQHQRKPQDQRLYMLGMHPYLTYEQIDRLLNVVDAGASLEDAWELINDRRPGSSWLRSRDRKKMLYRSH